LSKEGRLSDQEKQCGGMVSWQTPERQGSSSKSVLKGHADAIKIVPCKPGQVTVEMLKFCMKIPLPLPKPATSNISSLGIQMNL
jgi:hypothetical protein